MPNNPLLDRLVEDLRPVRRRSAGIDMAMITVLCALELALVLGLGMARPDMPAAGMQPSFWWKLASLGVIALVGGVTAIRSFDPVATPRHGLRWIAALVALCLGSGWFVAVIGDGSGQGLAARLDWHGGVQCVTKIVVLSVPVILGLALLMRRAAPTEPGGTALAAGIAAAAWGAFVFVFACPHDDPLYIAVWYGLACAIVTVLARGLLPWLTRW
jgi:hypothetical protein